MSQEFRPDWFSPPGATLAMLMTHRGLTVGELGSRMQKDASFVLRLLSGTERIEPSIADFLAQNVGATSSFWLKRQEMFDAALGRVAKAIPANDAKDWLRTLPLREMHHSGWLGLSSQESRLRAALSYFGVTSPDEWRERYAEHATK